jgi:hypothetical protein
VFVSTVTDGETERSGDGNVLGDFPEGGQRSSEDARDWPRRLSSKERERLARSLSGGRFDVDEVKAIVKTEPWRKRSNRESQILKVICLRPVPYRLRQGVYKINMGYLKGKGE